MTDTDRHYFDARADEHRRSAAEATNAEVAGIHEELASRYDALGAEADDPAAVPASDTPTQ